MREREAAFALILDITFNTAMIPRLLEAPMLRTMTVLLALAGLMAAAPALKQPAPASVPSKAETSDPAAMGDEKLREDEKIREAVERNVKTNEARDKVWDAQMKSTMSHICRGC